MTALVIVLALLVGLHAGCVLGAYLERRMYRVLLASAQADVDRLVGDNADLSQKLRDQARDRLYDDLIHSLDNWSRKPLARKKGPSA